MKNIQGINRTIFYEVSDSLLSYGIESETQEKIKRFLCTPPEDYVKRQLYARDVIERILKSHGKEKLLEEVIYLAQIEKHLIDLQDKLRDHVTHSLLTFLLGVYLIKNLGLHNFITPFEWKMTSFLHDIAYPYEIAFFLAKKVDELVNTIVETHRNTTPKLKSSHIIINLENLTKTTSSTYLLTKRLRMWGFEFSASSLYKDMKFRNTVDHGILSSMILLKVLDVLYSVHNPKRIKKYHQVNGNDWNYKNFENEIINSSASIFIHNLPVILFKKTKINKKDHPLAFVLRMADEMQDWERMTKNITYNTSDSYSIDIEYDKIYFCVPRSRLIKIKKSLECFDNSIINVTIKN